jgi:mRNA-degrading endonuclease RelE of RelBE toxin-antitoxin system
MSYRVIALPRFRKDIKFLAKKYPSIKNDYSRLIETLAKNPQQGISIGNNCFKIRLSIESKGKGKSGGARVITYVQVTKTTVYLLTIYDKSKQENITEKELSDLLKIIP